MSSYNLEKIQKKLKKYLDNERIEHTIGVRYTCAALAMCYGCDLERAQVAGLLHDSAKCIPNDQKLKLCKKHGISVTPAEKKSPFLLHAKLGAWIAREKYQVEDEEILSAICWHTTGKPKMTVLEKIVYIADYIEPWRKAAPNLDKIRAMAFQDLDLTMYVILKSTLFYLRQSGRETDPMTETAYEYYHQLCEITREDKEETP